MRDLKRMLSRQQFADLDDVNAFMQQFVGKPIPQAEPANDRERAEDLVLAARGERSASKRQKLVAQALSLDSDCVSAHLVLAADALTPSDALTHTRNAIAAGERVLAPLLAEEDAFLWGDLIGRDWLIARAQLAELHWQMGDRPRAIADVREVLRLNPGDNHGMRYVLLQWLMRAGSLEGIDQLLAQYHERSTPWLFTRALHSYRTTGVTAETTRALRAAMSANGFVVPMLLGAHPMPEEPPESYSPGGDDEAAIYVESALTLWVDTMGAIEWAASTLPKAPPLRRTRRR
jgi:hypothetical protein